MLQYEHYNAIGLLVAFVVIVAIGYIVNRVSQKPRNSDDYEEKR